MLAGGCGGARPRRAFSDGFSQRRTKSEQRYVERGVAKRRTKRPPCICETTKTYVRHDFRKMRSTYAHGRLRRSAPGACIFGRIFTTPNEVVAALRRAGRCGKADKTSALFIRNYKKHTSAMTSAKCGALMLTGGCGGARPRRRFSDGFSQRRTKS